MPSWRPITAIWIHVYIERGQIYLHTQFSETIMNISPHFVLHVPRACAYEVSERLSQIYIYIYIYNIYICPRPIKSDLPITKPNNLTNCRFQCRVRKSNDCSISEKTSNATWSGTDLISQRGLEYWGIWWPILILGPHLISGPILIPGPHLIPIAYCLSIAYLVPMPYGWLPIDNAHRPHMMGPLRWGIGMSWSPVNVSTCEGHM